MSNTRYGALNSKIINGVEIPVVEKSNVSKDQRERNTEEDKNLFSSYVDGIWGGIKDFAKGTKDFAEGLRQSYTGEYKETEYDYPEVSELVAGGLFTAQKDFGDLSAEIVSQRLDPTYTPFYLAGTMGGQMELMDRFLGNDERYQGFEYDKYRNPILIWDNKPYYLNKPGFSRTDFNTIIAEMAYYLPKEMIAAMMARRGMGKTAFMTHVAGTPVMESLRLMLQERFTPETAKKIDKSQVEALGIAGDKATETRLMALLDLASQYGPKVISSVSRVNAILRAKFKYMSPTNRKLNMRYGGSMATRHDPNLWKNKDFTNAVAAIDESLTSAERMAVPENLNQAQREKFINLRERKLQIENDFAKTKKGYPSEALQARKIQQVEAWLLANRRLQEMVRKEDLLPRIQGYFTVSGSDYDSFIGDEYLFGKRGIGTDIKTLNPGMIRQLRRDADAFYKTATEATHPGRPFMRPEGLLSTISDIHHRVLSKPKREGLSPITYKKLTEDYPVLDEELAKLRLWSKELKAKIRRRDSYLKDLDDYEKGLRTRPKPVENAEDINIYLDKLHELSKRWRKLEQDTFKYRKNSLSANLEWQYIREVSEAIDDSFTNPIKKGMMEGNLDIINYLKQGDERYKAYLRLSGKRLEDYGTLEEEANAILKIISDPNQSPRNMVESIIGTEKVIPGAMGIVSRKLKASLKGLDQKDYIRLTALVKDAFLERAFVGKAKRFKDITHETIPDNFSEVFVVNRDIIEEWFTPEEIKIINAVREHAEPFLQTQKKLGNQHAYKYSLGNALSYLKNEGLGGYITDAGKSLGKLPFVGEFAESLLISPVNRYRANKMLNISSMNLNSPFIVKAPLAATFRSLISHYSDEPSDLPDDKRYDYGQSTSGKDKKRSKKAFLESKTGSKSLDDISNNLPGKTVGKLKKVIIDGHEIFVKP